MAQKEFMDINDASVYLEELKTLIANSMVTFTVTNQNLTITAGINPTDDNDDNG